MVAWMLPKTDRDISAKPKLTSSTSTTSPLERRLRRTPCTARENSSLSIQCTSCDIMAVVINFDRWTRGRILPQPSASTKHTRLYALESVTNNSFAGYEAAQNSF